MNESYTIKITTEQRVREPVRWFSSEMESKLQANDHKGDWDKCTQKFLLKRLEEELNELKKAIKEKRVAATIRECADVANFCMMIADNLDVARWKKVEKMFRRNRGAT